MAMFLHHYLVEGIAWICSDLLLQGENQDSDHWWSDPVTAVFEHHCLVEGVVVEELFRCPCGVKR